MEPGSGPFKSRDGAAAAKPGRRGPFLPGHRGPLWPGCRGPLSPGRRGPLARPHPLGHLLGRSHQPRLRGGPEDPPPRGARGRGRGRPGSLPRRLVLAAPRDPAGVRQLPGAGAGPRHRRGVRGRGQLLAPPPGPDVPIGRPAGAGGEAAGAELGAGAGAGADGAGVGGVPHGGVDETVTMTLDFGEKRQAVFTVSIAAQLPGVATLGGTRGWAQFPSHMNCPTELVLGGGPQAGGPQGGGPRRETFPLPPPDQPLNFPHGTGLRYEAQHVRECLLQGLTESPVMPFAASELVAQLLDEARGQVGVGGSPNPPPRPLPHPGEPPQNRGTPQETGGEEK